MNFWEKLLLVIEELFGGDKYIAENPLPVKPPLPMPPTPPAPVPKNLLQEFCQEIKNMEGWFPGSTSFKCNNPGNLRCTVGNEKNWNALSSGQLGGFCTFKDEPTGMQALRNVTLSVAKGLSTTYNIAAKRIGLSNGANLNLYQYFIIRDPATDGNNPELLAERFGKVLGVNPAAFKMKNLLN